MPHLQELVELHKDNPFALIGINTGDDPETYRKGVEDFGVSWLSAYQGQSSPISDLYKVRGYPTYVLIDAEGVIQGVGHSGKAYDDQIAEMVAALKKQ